MRKCFWHFGHTFKFSSRSFFHMICRQFSHFTHRPSVRTVFFPELSRSPDSRLNQAIRQFLVPSTWYRVNNAFLGIRYWVLSTWYSVLDSPLRHHALLIRMLYLSHLRHRVGDLDNCGVCVPSRQDDMHHFWFPLQALDHLARVEHAVTDRIIDLIEHHQVPLARLDRLLALGPCLFHHLHIFQVRLFGAHLHKTPAHLLHHELIPKRLNGIQFPVMPRAFQELQHEHAHPLAHSAQSRTHGRGRLSFTRPGVHDDKTSAYVSHWLRRLDSTRKNRSRWPVVSGQ